jgi:pteridine reductase
MAIDSGGKVKERVLITGAARRIGRALALDLASKGYEIVVHYNRSREEALAVAALIQKGGGRVHLIQKQLDSESAVIELWDELTAREILPSVVINSASTFAKDHFSTSEQTDLESSMVVNSYVPHWMTRELTRRVTTGQVIHLLDTRITCYDSEHFSYHLSKRNLFTLTRLAALELAPSFRVNGVAPGAILPPEAEDEAYLQARAEETPLKAVGDPAMVVDAVNYLLSAKLVTGQILYIDGGYHLKGALYGA